MIYLLSRRAGGKTPEAMFQSPQSDELLPFVPDLRKDKFHVWISKWHWVPITVLGIVLFLVGGWPFLLWGIFQGSFDVSMNAQAIAVEGRVGRRLIRLMTGSPRALRTCWRPVRALSSFA